MIGGFTDDPDDQIKLELDQWSAGKQPRYASRRTLETLTSRANKGKRNGGRAPYGYDLQYSDASGNSTMRVQFFPAGKKKWTRHVFDRDGKHILTLGSKQPLPVEQDNRYTLVPGDPAQVHVVQRIFDMYVVQDMGFPRITEVLNREGVPAPGGDVWLRTSVRSIITNPAYRGDLAWNRTTFARFHRLQGKKVTKRRRSEFKKHSQNDTGDWIKQEGAHEPLVDPELFDRAQHILGKRRKKHAGASFRSGRAKNARYLLCSLIHCLRCGRKFQGYKQTKKKRRIDGTPVETFYYACNGYVNVSKDICPRTLFRRENLDGGVLGLVTGQVNGVLSNGGMRKLKTLLARELKAMIPDSQKEIRRVKTELCELASNRKRLVATLTPKNKEVLDGEFERLAEREKDLLSRLAELASPKHKEVDINATVDEVMASVKGFEDLFPHGTLEEQKEFIRLWVEKIELDPDKRVGKVYMKKFPLPANGNGNASFEMVAGARYTHQKRNFPPIDVINIQFEYQGKALVPVSM